MVHEHRGPHRKLFVNKNWTKCRRCEREIEIQDKPVVGLGEDIFCCEECKAKYYILIRLRYSYLISTEDKL